jgi:hypothetical protein
MQTTIASRPTSLSLNKSIFPALILIALFLAGLLAFRALTPAPVRPVTPISPAMLEEKYGLRVNLVAVTAAGGMVDFRLKILDGAKAKLLLQDAQNFPALEVTGTGVILAVPADSRTQPSNFENGSNFLLLFPNSRNIVKPGAQVSVRFGALMLEPIVVK